MDTHIELPGFERADYSVKPVRRNPPRGNIRQFALTDRSWPGRILGDVRRWWECRRANRRLESLNDHYLMDIGLERPDIASLIAKSQNMDETPQ